MSEAWVRDVPPQPPCLSEVSLPPAPDIMYVYIHIHMYIHIICIYIYVCIYVYIYICNFLYIIQYISFTILAVLDVQKRIKLLCWSLPHGSKLGNSQKVHGTEFPKNFPKFFFWPNPSGRVSFFLSQTPPGGVWPVWIKAQVFLAWFSLV